MLHAMILQKRHYYRLQKRIRISLLVLRLRNNSRTLSHACGTVTEWTNFNSYTDITEISAQDTAKISISSSEPTVG
jgi:hypothetical protein